MLKRSRTQLVAVVFLASLMLFAANAMAQAGSAPATPPKAAAVPPPPPPAEPGVAPSGGTAEIEALNKQAMDAYVRLDYITAKQQLEEAFQLCSDQGAAGRPLSLTFLNLGILYSGGLNDQVQAIEYFTKALQTDASIAPDPKTAGPNAMATFEKVRAQLGITGPSVAVPGPGMAAPIQPVMPPEGFWVMKHTRVTQAKRLYPIGIYIEVNPMVSIKEAVLYFRFPSDRVFQAAVMERKGNLLGLLITCESIALLDPEAIYYYIDVVGANGSIIASEGSAATPIEIKMIDEKAFTGVQPILPGMQQPLRCNPDEVAPCPPWDPNCKDNPCTEDKDCIGNKGCVKGFCREKAPGEKEESKGVGLYIQLGVGTGAGLVTGSVPAKYSEKDISLASGFSWSPFFVRLGLGLFVADDWTVGLHTRIQAVPFDSGAFPAMILPTARYYAVNNESLKLHVDLEVDVYGAMLHNITLKDLNPDTGEWETYTESHASGMQAIGAGTGLVYLFSKNVGLSVDLMMDAMFPTFAFNFDLYAGLYINL